MLFTHKNIGDTAQILAQVCFIRISQIRRRTILAIFALHLFRCHFVLRKITQQTYIQRKAKTVILFLMF